MRLSYLIAVLLIAGSASQLFAQMSGTIYFNNGKIVEAEIMTANTSSLTWKNYETNQVQTAAYSSFSKVDFQPTGAWVEAEELFTQARYAEAGKAYFEITKNPKESLYPVPGNLASLALRKVMDCHRRLLEPAKVTSISAKIKPELKTMPPELQKLSPTELAWIQAGRKEWAQVVKIAEENKVTGADATELAFLAGQGSFSLGEKLKALDYYTKAYAFGYGSNPKVAKYSLRKSAEIVSTLNDEERAIELQSQLKIYKELFGAGSLWEGASPDLVKLSKAELDTIDFNIGKGALSKIPAGLPALKDRDWIHPLEIETPLYVLNHGPMDTKKAGNSGRPKREGNDYIFNGGNVMWKDESVKLNDGVFEVQMIFIPEADDGFLFSAGELNKGVALFMKKGDLILAWHTTKGSRKEFNLGKVSVTKETQLHIEVTTEVKAKLALGSKLKSYGEIPKKTPLDKAYKFEVSPDATYDKVTDYDLPRFKGRIRFLGVGTGKDVKSLRDAEKKMFKGKVVSTKTK